MKRLNLNNTIATTAMLTKTNTMKSKMNLFAKVVLLVAVMGMLFGEGAWNKVCGQNPQYNNGTWYSLYDNKEYSRGSSKGEYHTYTLYPPCESRVDYEFKKSSSGALAMLRIFSSTDGGQNQTKIEEPSSFGKNWEGRSCNIDIDINWLQFYRYSLGFGTGYLRNVHVILAKHVRFESGSAGTASKSMSFNDIVVGETSSITDIDLRSFYTSGSLMVKIEDNGTDGSCTGGNSLDQIFKIYKNDIQVASDSLESGTNICGFKGGGANGSVNTTNYLKVQFCPDRAKTYKAKITIYDSQNPNVCAVLSVEGTGTVKSGNELTWTTTGSFYAFQTITAGNQVTANSTKGCTGNISYSNITNLESLGNEQYKIQSAGDFTIRATQLADCIWGGATSDKTVTASKVTPVINSFDALSKGYVGTLYNLSGKADWAAESGQPARSAWINGDGVVMKYTSNNTSIAADGTTFTPQKAGLVTITASIDAANNHNASTVNRQQPLQIDFNPNVIIHTFQNAVKVGSETTEVINLADFFVPNGSYSAAVTSGSEFSVINGTNISDNTITVKFAPTSISEETASSEVKEAIIKITNDGKEYSFKIQATAEKAEANLKVFCSGDTYVFSEITLSNSKSTTANVTYKINGVAISGNTYKIPSVSPITISATTPANAGYMAGYAELEPFTPGKVRPKVTNWSGSYDNQKVGIPCELGQANWDVDETLINQPAMGDWEGEVMIDYTSSDNRIAKVNGSNLEFHRAGLASIIAMIPEGTNYRASENNPTKTVKVDFADDAVNCGTMFVGETPATYDITDMIIPAGILTYTTTDNDFSVDFSNNKIVVVYNPSTYHETSTATITFTDGNGEVYSLNVSAGCVKHPSLIRWKQDVNTMVLAYDETGVKRETDLIDAASSSYNQPLKFKSSNVAIVQVYDENYAVAEWGVNIYPLAKGTVTIYAKSEETMNQTEALEEKEFTIVGEAKSKIAWNQSFLRIYNDQGSIPLTAEVQAGSNSTPIAGATVTYHLLDVQNNVVTLNGCTLKIASGATGTAKIYAEFAGNDDYIGCVSETLNINVVARVVGGCSEIAYGDVTENSTTYYFNNNKTSSGEPYFEVEKVEYYYYVKGDNGQMSFSGKGATRTIKAMLGTKEHSISGEGGANSILFWEVEDAIPVQGGPYILTPKQGETPTFISFSGDIKQNGSKFTEIKVTPKSYFRENTTFVNPFAGSDTKVDEETTKSFSIGKYSNLSDYTIKLYEQNSNDEYSGGEFSIVDGGNEDNYPDGCNDYGDWNITVKFKPISGKPEKTHKCRIGITYKKGTDGSTITYDQFHIEAMASRYTQPDIIWNQTLSGLTSLCTKPIGENWTSEEPIELTEISGLSNIYGTQVDVDKYEIIAGTDVAEIVNDKYLSIKKAGQFTIKAIHNGDDKYESTSEERTIDVALSNPTIELSYEGNKIVENGTIEVTHSNRSYTIGGNALYDDSEIFGYNVGEKIKLSSSAPDVVSVIGDQLQFLKSGEAEITATIEEDDIVNAASFKFIVNVDPADQNVTITNDPTTEKLFTNDTENGITLTATAVNALDGETTSDGTISYEITSGGEYAEIKDVNKLVSKKNGVGRITVVAHCSATDNYNEGLSEPMTFEMEKATPTITWETAPEETMTFTDRMTFKAITDNDDEDAKISYIVNSVSGSAKVQTVEDLTMIVPIQVGEIEIIPKISETQNYKAFTAEDISQKVNITEGSLEFTIADISMHYGDPELTITPEDGGFVGYIAAYTIASENDYQYIKNSNGVISNGRINVIRANPGQTITVNPSFTLANYIITSQPFTVTIDKAEQSLTWETTTKEMSTALIGQDAEIDAPAIGYKYAGIENEITYTSSDESYVTVLPVTGRPDKIRIRMHKYSATPIMISASYAGNENVESASTTTPFSLTMILQAQKVVWDAEADTIVNNIYTTQNTNTTIATLKGHTESLQKALTGNKAKFSIEVSDVCPEEAALVTMDTVPLENNDTMYNVKYVGDGSGHVKIIAYGVTDKGYEHTKPEYEKTIEFNVLPAPATVAWNTDEFDDAHYGDVIEMTPSVTPDKGDKVFAYTFEEGKNLTCQGNVLSIKDVATEGTTITARNTEDCFLAADVDGYTRSVTINKTGQEIIWNQSDMTLNVIGSNDVQLTAYAIDSRHKSQATTCLTLNDGNEYITAKTAGDDNVTPSETGMTITYDVKEIDDVCKPDGEEQKIVEVDENGLLHVTGVGTGRVRITPSVSGGAHYNAATGTESIIVTVNKVNPVITFTRNEINGGNEIYYSQKGLPLNASSTYGSGAYTYSAETAENGGAILINNENSTFNATHAGKVNITVVKATDCIAENETKIFNDVEIKKADQVITWNPLETSLLATDNTYDKGILLDAVAHNALDDTEVSTASANIEYEIITNEDGLADVAEIVEVDGKSYLVAKGTGAGSVKVLATASASDNFNEKTETKTFSVNKADADFFTIADIIMTYNDKSIGLNDKISGGTLTLGTDYQVSYSVGVNGTGYFNVDDANKTINPLKANVDNNGNLVEMTLNASITGMTNYNDRQITGKVYVQRATQAIVWSGIQTSYNTWNDGGGKTINLDDYTQSKDVSHGNANITPDLTKTYELEISGMTGCDINDANVAYIDNDNVLHITGAASATLTIYAKQDGTDNNGENYTKIEKANNCSTVISINKITPTITFERSNVNGGADVYYSDEVTYTVSSTGTDYSVSDVSAFTFDVTPVDGGAISENKASHAGNVKIKASQAADCMINGAESGEVDVEIKKAPQSVSWKVKDLGTLSATSTEGVELTAVAMNSRQNTPSGMTITYTVCDALGNDITSGARIRIGNDNKVYSAHKGSGEAWVKAVANDNDNYEASETPVIKKITIEKEEPTITWIDPCSGQMTMHYRDEKQLTFSCDYAGYTASYSLTEPSDDTYVDMTELTTNGNVKIIGVKPDNGTIGIKVTISDPKGNYSDGELVTAISTLKNNTEIDWTGQSFGTYTTADAEKEIELTAYVKDLYKGDNSGKPVAYDFKGTNAVEGCGNIVELTDDGKLKITGNAAGTVTLYANYAGDENYNASTEKSMQITVGKQTPRFEWTDNTGIQATYGETGKTAVATHDGTGTVTYSSSDGNVATIDEDGNITIVGAGTTTLSATLAADCQYEAVTTAIEKTLTVGKAACTITVTGPQNITFGQTGTLLYSTSNTDANLQVTFTSGNTGIVSISGDQVTGAGAGTTYVYAVIAESDNYLQATSDDFNITVGKAQASFTIDDIALTYGDLNHAVIINNGGITDYTVSFNINDGDKSYISINSNNNIDAIGAKCDDQGIIIDIPVTAHFTSTNYEIPDVQFNVTVAKADQTITWDENKDYNVSNMIGSIDLSGYCSGTSGGGTITFSSLDTTVAKVSGNYLVIKKITTLSTVTITATAEGTDNYEKATADTVFTITAEEPTLEISQDYSGKIINLASTKKKVSSVTDDVDFAKLLIDEEILICNYESATYTFVSSDPTVATFDENGKIIAYKKADNLAITVTAHVGEMEASIILHFKIPRGVMEFKNNGNWHDNGKWVRTDMLPSAEDHDVSIQANCIIQDDSTAVCYNLNITDSGSLSVSPNAVLNVTDTITNSEASKLTLKANENHSATVLFATGSPSATVENYIQGGLHSEGEGENRINNPDWQYRGFVGNNPSLSGVWNVVIFKWNETLNNTNCWGTDPVYTNETVNYSFSPWDGYCMANYDGGHEREYTSKLIPSDTIMTYKLSYTDHGQQYPNRGVNLITNSWSAPIDMSSSAVTFEGDDEATFYFYTTMNHKAWENKGMKSFVTYPQKSGEAVNEVSSLIAAGQSFLVKTKVNGRKLTIGSAALAHEANGKMYAPAEKERFNVLSITMSNDTMADRVFLLESENCSRAFDNGYDGTKIKEGNMPQIFASNDFGHTAVNTDKTMLGQRIGYSAAEDGALCTITFNTERLDGFSELYLYDRVAKRYADILAGDSYSFTGTKAGEEERFEIVGRRDDGSEFVTSSDMMIEVVGNHALLSGFAGGNDEVFITDMNGKRLWTERASNGPWFELPNLPAGVYLINCGEANCKFIVK